MAYACLTLPSQGNWHCKQFANAVPIGVHVSQLGLQGLMQHNTGRKEKTTPLSIDQRNAEGRNTLAFPVDQTE